MSEGLWPASPSEMAEVIRIEMAEQHVTDFLNQAMDRLREHLATEGFEVDGREALIADQVKGEATRRFQGSVTTRADGSATGILVSACLDVLIKTAGANADWVRLTYRADDGGPFPFLTSAPVAAKLKRGSPQADASGFLLPGTLAEIAALCATDAHARLAGQFCMKVGDRLTP